MMQFEKPEADFQVLGLSSVHRLVYGVISVISGLYCNPLPFLDMKKLCGGSTCRI